MSDPMPYDPAAQLARVLDEGAAEVAALEARIEELTKENERLAAQNERSKARKAELTEQRDAARAEAKDAGERLSSYEGSRTARAAASVARRLGRDRGAG